MSLQGVQLPVEVAAPRDSRLEELQQRVDALTAEVAARDIFIAFAAHELRNPMTPIIGQLELLLSMIKAGQCEPVQVEQKLERIQNSVSRYLKRAAVLLDVSRINNGKLKLELESFDVARLMRDIACTFKDELRRAGVSITVTAPDRLLGTWDRLALEQIIDNLISNAIKYGARTPVDLSAETDGEQVRLRVRDYGSGVPVQDRERVFGRFERAVGRGDRHGGFGVGLWVVCQLAEAMNGGVTIEDAPGGGALFTVILPQHVKQAGA
jgi:two-component system OmpR family sensor kinase